MAYSQAERLEKVMAYLVAELESEPGSRKRVTLESLADRFEVTRRTIQRDLEELKGRHGMEIVWDNSGKTYYLIGEYSLQPMFSFKRSQLFSLCIGSVILEQYKGTPLHGELAQAMEVLLQKLDLAKTRISLADLRRSLSVRPEPPRTFDKQVFDTTLNAIQRSKPLRIHYQAPGARASSRTIHPYHLLGYCGDFYVLSWCTKQKDIRFFALSRILTCEILARPFDPDPSVEKELKRHLEEGFGIFRGETETTVRLRFNKQQAPYVRERTWVAGQKTRNLDDGRLEISFTVGHLFEVQRWVQSWGSAVEVLEPAHLRDAVARELKQAGRQYS